MAWLWSSWEEYKENVQPVLVTKEGMFREVIEDSWFEIQQLLNEAFQDLNKAHRSLKNLGFDGSGYIKFYNDHPEIITEAKDIVLQLIYAGESLLLYHKRLATSRAAYGFLHQNDLIEHWDSYNDNRTYMEIDQLVLDTDQLLSGYHEIRESDERFLIYGLDLPPELKTDFRLAMNLFSVGFNDIGILIAGRGLEGVLRRIAEIRKIKIDIKGKLEPAFDSDFHDLIEVMYRIRWKGNGTRLITSETKALLHYLRTLRNKGAHSELIGSQTTIGPRETAAVVAETANQLWKNITGTRARLDKNVVEKNW